MGKVSAALCRQHPTWKRAMGTRMPGVKTVSLTGVLPLFPINDNGQCFTKVYGQVLLLSSLYRREFERPVHTRQGPVHMCLQNSTCHLPSAEGQAGPWDSPNCEESGSAWKEVVRKGPCQPVNYQIFLVRKSCLLPDGGKESPCQSMCGPEMKAGKPVRSVLEESRVGMPSTPVQSELCQLSGHLLRPGVASTLCPIPCSHAHTHIETALGQLCTAVMGCKEHFLICLPEEPSLGNR